MLYISISIFKIYHMEQKQFRMKVNKKRQGEMTPPNIAHYQIMKPIHNTELELPSRAKNFIRTIYSYMQI